MWKFIARIMSLKTPWIEMIGERWIDDAGNNLEYWRTIAPDSVIVIPELNGQYLLPRPMFRPGVSKETLDFPGGRQHEGKTPEQMAPLILERELGIPAAAIAQLRPINVMPLIINSSNSSQHLHGFHAVLDADTDLQTLNPHTCFATTDAGIQDLMDRLDCLQCRALLLEHRSAG